MKKVHYCKEYLSFVLKFNKPINRADFEIMMLHNSSSSASSNSKI